MFLKPQPLHFTGIGGIGMSGLAEVMLGMGFAVSGSDLQLSAVTERLRKLGATVWEGHDAAHVGAAGAVIVTSAAGQDNPEIEEARRRGIPVVRRGELLAELMRTKYGIAAGGSHGKTSTTTMIAGILLAAAMDPTVIVGGRVAQLEGSTARLGAGPYLVAESDESDGSFLLLRPVIAVITNIDREHLDYYATLAEIEDAFAQFANSVPFYGCAVVCGDDKSARGLLPRLRRPVVTYGFWEENRVRITDLERSPAGSRFRIMADGGAMGEFLLPAPGLHNVLNATAAICVARELGIGAAKIEEGLAGYRGVDRRFQKRGEAAGVAVIDDYGHHPTEIRATLAAARQCGYGGVHVIFQPHRYTRTQHLMEEFAACFPDADSVQVMDIYAASEKPVAGVTAEVLAQQMRDAGHAGAYYAGSAARAVEAALAAAGPGDAVITLGAGSVWRCGDELLERLRAKERVDG
jgi:UDP-N-acetylmuramate--alanine ligase